jgi:hypothetical protein
MPGPVATNGEFPCSVKVIRAITTTIAARIAMMSPLPHWRGPRRVRSSLMVVPRAAEPRSSVPWAERGATSGPGSRSRLCSSRSKSAIRRGMVLGTSDRAASSRATVAWISLIIRCLRADCRVSPVPCLRAMRAPRASILCGNARTGLFVPKSGSPWEAVRGSPRGNLEPELWLCERWPMTQARSLRHVI